MYYATFPSPAHLAPYVRFFWVLEGKGPYIHRSMATTCPEMVFHYKGNFRDLMSDTKSLEIEFCGPSNRHQRYGTDEDFGIVGAFLYPFVLPELFGHSADAVSNEVIGMQDLAGKGGREWGMRILEANGNAERVRLLAGFFEEKLAGVNVRENGMDHFIRQIVHRPMSFEVEVAAQEAGISRRQFERRFRTRAGFGPKNFSRIARFQQSLQQYDHPFSSLADIAYACGYYDQSHFASEFKRFSGHRPRDYFLRHGEGTAWRNA